MPLTALQHVAHTSSVPASNTVEEWLNEMYDTLNGNMTYWDVGRYQNGGTTEAVYFTPKAATEADDADLRIIFAGVDSGAPTPPMGDSCSLYTGYLYVGLCVDGGAFNAWDDPDPFTSGDFSGYLYCYYDSLTLNDMIILESAGTIIAHFSDGTYGKGGAWAGACFDAESTHPANSYDEDGRVYACLTGGRDVGWFMYTLGTNSAPFHHDTGIDEPKAVSIIPGSGGWETIECVGAASYSNFQYETFGDQSPWMVPIYAFAQTTPYNLLGRAREVFIGPGALSRDEIFDSGASPVARLLGYSESTPYTCLAVKY